jgi:drug/metabolite transporter (DMT)-like permease
LSRTRVFMLTLFAMIAFAGNSILCRLALTETGIDAASFTSLRLVSGALCLGAIARLRGGGMSGAAGSWASGMALFLYAAGFSFAYLTLPAGTGALLLFGAVQVTMIGWGIRTGERLNARQAAGFLCAFGGLVGLLLPGLSAPPPGGALLMLGAGVAWGIYSLRGTGTGDAVRITAGNFLRAVPFAAALSAALITRATPDGRGAWYALASGVLASGVGYAIWYSALKGLKTTSAATVQLSVPVLAALGGIAFLGEQITARLLLAAAAILGGIALVMCERR